MFRRAMGRRDNKRKKRQRMRAAAAAAAAAARLCNINLRRADQKAGELSCVPAESERWREFSPLGLPGLTLDSLRAHSLRPAARRAAQDVGNATPSGGRRFHPLRSDHISPTHHIS